MSSKPKNGFSCEECSKDFASRRTLIEHLRNIHNKQPLLRKRSFMICPICDEQFRYRQDLFSHLPVYHEIKINFERKEFNNLNEFIEWKENMEKETKSQYVLKRGVKTLANQSKKLFYQCSRSGDYKQDKLAKHSGLNNCDAKSGKKPRRPRLVGSKRIGKLCPATLEVTYSSSHVTALFWSTHVGHTNDIKYCYLSKLERRNIATKLAVGKTADHILNDIKKSIPQDEAQLTRLHLITRKDLNNIQYQSAINDAKKIIIYVESESDLQAEIREKVEQIRKLCDSTVFEEEICNSIIGHLDSAINIVKASQECSLISSITEISDDEKADKKKKTYSMRRKRKVRKNRLQDLDELSDKESAIIVEVEEDSVDASISNDHSYL